MRRIKFFGAQIARAHRDVSLVDLELSAAVCRRPDTDTAEHVAWLDLLADTDFEVQDMFATPVLALIFVFGWHAAESGRGVAGSPTPAGSKSVLKNRLPGSEQPATIKGIPT